MATAIQPPAQIPTKGDVSVTGITEVTEDLQELHTTEDDLQRHMRVKADSNVRKVAGSICHSCRGQCEIMKGENKDSVNLDQAEIACEVIAAGNNAINQAIKSIAIARMWLANEGIYMLCKPCFEPLGAMQFKLFIHFNADAAALEECTVTPILHEKGEIAEEKKEAGSTTRTMRVATSTDPYNLAGAVATVIRETPGTASLQLSAQGPAAVSQTARALVYTRGYLQSDSIDLGFQPFFAVAKMPTGEERSILRFDVTSFPSETSNE